MLKIIALSALLSVALGARAGASPGDLVVGSVRDGSGLPVSGADVRGIGDDGNRVGETSVDADGTFALAVSSAAKFVEIRCRHCRTSRTAVGASQNLVLIVQRYAALESDTPSPNDLAALPYGKIADDLALMPFVVPSAGDANVSDRALAGGRGLILDSGVPVVDLATGNGGLADFPDRYVQSISVVGPEQAFRYGSYSGGGIFALGPNADSSTYASADFGGAPSIAVEPVLGSEHPAFGESDDDGTLSRRADLAVTTAFAGGVLDASVGSAGELFSNAMLPADFSRTVNLYHVGYATSSRHYRSFVDLSAADVSLFDHLENVDEYRSSYLSADVRLERPGPVTLAIGALTTRQTAFSLDDVPVTGRSFDETSYVSAQTGTEHAGAYAGLGLSNVTVLDSLRSGPTDGSRLALLPSVGGSAPFGSSGAYARVGYSEALRVPTLVESETQLYPPPNGAPLERDELEESALGFDNGGRVRAEAIAYREDVHGFDERRQLGIGASVVWQVAPLVSVRAWTLRASPEDYYDTYYGLPAQARTSRQVAWASYANGDGLRFDAIAHRDIDGVTTGVELDGDVYVPVVRDLALDLGTAESVGPRRFYFGFRTR